MLLSSSVMMTAIKKQHVPKLGYQQVHIECNKITLITLPSLWQEFSDITCEIFNLTFTLAAFPTFWTCTSWYKLQNVFCRFADDASLLWLNNTSTIIHGDIRGSEDACVKNGYYLHNFSIGMVLDEIANSEDLCSRQCFEANLCCHTMCF
jgi:hypothetical protein